MRCRKRHPLLSEEHNMGDQKETHEKSVTKTKTDNFVNPKKGAAGEPIKESKTETNASTEDGVAGSLSSGTTLGKKTS